MLDKKPEARPGSLEPVYDASMPWRYLAPAGHTLEMCQQPDYWSLNTRELGMQRVLGRHAWNKIEIIAEDGSWEADLRVLSVEQGVAGAGGRVFTRTIREWHKPVEQRKAAVPEGYKVEHIQGNGWRVVDPKSNVIRDKIAIEDEAVRTAVNHARKGRGE